MGVDAIPEETNQDRVALAADLCSKHGRAAGPSVDDEGHERSPAIQGRLHLVVSDQRRQIPDRRRRQPHGAVGGQDLHEGVGELAFRERVLGKRMQMDAGAVGGRCQFGGGDGANLSVQVAPQVDVEGGVDRHIGDRQQQPECQRPPQRELHPERHPRAPADHDAAASCLSM